MIEVIEPSKGVVEIQFDLVNNWDDNVITVFFMFDGFYFLLC